MKYLLLSFLVLAHGHSLFDEEPAVSPKGRPIAPAPREVGECPPLEFKEALRPETPAFVTPHGMGIDERRKVLYVASTYDGRIYAYSLGFKLLGSIDLNTTLLGKTFPAGKKSPGGAEVRDVIVDSATGELTVTLSFPKPMLVKMTPKGKVISKIEPVPGPKADGEKPAADKGNFKTPYQLVKGPDDKLYFSDPTRATVHVFGKDGKFVDEMGFPGRNRGSDWQENYGIAYDAKRRAFYVTDFEFPGALTKYDENFKQVWRVSNPPGEEGYIGKAYGVAVDGQGDVYVSIHAPAKVVRFSADGKQKATYTLPPGGRGQADPAKSELRLMKMVGCDLFVADGGNGQILRFGPKQ